MAKPAPVKSPAVEPTEPQPEARVEAAPASASGDESPVASRDRPAAEPAGAAPSAADRAPASVNQLAEQPSAAQKPSTEELLARPFATAPDQPDSGENLAFDFHDEPPIEDEPAPLDPADTDSSAASGGSLPFARKEPARWQVGDDLDLATPAAPTDRFAIGTPPSGRGRRRPAAPGAGPGMLDEGAAPIYNRGVTRSARFFLALFFLMAGGFAVTTFAIHAAPAAALDLLNRLPVIGSRFVSPVVPARMVALRDVHAEYRRGRDGRLALVVAGQAENVSHTALHTIRIMARIWTASAGAVARRQVYCGNSLATRTIAQMTTHEIEFFQELPPPKAFSLESSSACPFVIVFVDPPAQLAHFDIAVTEADPAGADDPAAPVG